MSEWCYKATKTKVTFEETRDLAVTDGFLCRSAYEANASRADNTQHVEFRDTIHVYFMEDQVAHVIGSFEVVGPNRHPHPERFRQGVTGTALFEVSDDFATLVTSLGTGDGEGYKADPVLKKVTGWALVHRPDVATPPFEGTPLAGQQPTLLRR
jgi:hypothetical protein